MYHATAYNEQRLDFWLIYLVSLKEYTERVNNVQQEYAEKKLINLFTVFDTLINVFLNRGRNK